MQESRKKELKHFLKQFNLDIQDYELLNIALTHPSYVFEKEIEDTSHNQRLEFLGDAVVDLVVGEYLFEQFPNKTEGELTKMRAALVCESSLSHAAQRVNLGEYLLIGKGERSCGGAKRASNLADAWESFIGSLYLQIGIEGVKPIVLTYIQPEMDGVIKGHYGDYKTQLQEVVQKQPDAQIVYEIIAELGPDHDKEFTARVSVNQEAKAEGKGKTKKEAEQHAAFHTLIKMGEIHE